ncbi:MAG: glycosyltransferase family 2 protein [Caldilineaceae bacterium]|nr:glycosyltransferase family 2 protein [Caldilineaceae bacterium]
MVIPAYNEELRLPPTLARVATFLRTQPYRAEVIVVENGSTDQTVAAVQHFIQEQVRPEDPFSIRLLQSTPGKGAAVKHGMLHAQGAYAIMSDADLSVPIEDVPRYLPPALPSGSFDIAIASREVPGAVRHGEPSYRHLMGRVFNWLVRLMAVPKIQDTQCGFKCFTREAAQLLFPLQRIDGWGFDVEILHIATHYQLRMIEVPATWYYGVNSRVRPLHDTLNMVKELLKIRANSRQGYYDRPRPSSRQVDQRST